MNRYEVLGLTSQQIKELTEIAATYTAAGCPTSVEDLVWFAFSPTKADMERLAKIRLPKQPWHRIFCANAHLFLYFLICLLAYFVGAGLGHIISRIIMVLIE